MTEQRKRKGGRPLKGSGSRRSLTIRLAPVTREWLDREEAATGQPLTDIVERAVESQMPKISAPFTAAQVVALNQRQGDGRFHPFTCANRDDGAHAGEGLLVATGAPAGWVCPWCKYTQGWAWAFQAGGGA